MTSGLWWFQMSSKMYVAYPMTDSRLKNPTTHFGTGSKAGRHRFSIATTLYS